jgi:hypothetical protein
MELVFPNILVKMKTDLKIWPGGQLTPIISKPQRNVQSHRLPIYFGKEAQLSNDQI